MKREKIVAYVLGILIGIFSVFLFNSLSEKKFLIIHSDDFGLSDSHNSATIFAMREGLVTSASLMVPCPKRDEAIELWRENQDLDIGIHLTFTSEWKDYKWGGVAEDKLISSLLDSEGYMYPDCASFLEHAKKEEIEIELRAQIEYVLQKGLKPTHLDAHMSCLFRGSAEIIFTYLKVAQEYGITAMLTKENFKKINSNDFLSVLDLENIGIIDGLFIADEKNYDDKGMEKLYSNILNKVSPGFFFLLIHTSYIFHYMVEIT